MDRRDFIKISGSGVLGLTFCEEAYSLDEVKDNIDFNSLKRKFETLNWAGYSPTNYNPNYGVFPSSDSVRRDLDVLLDAGIEGVATYGANDGLKNIPRLARDRGMKGVVMGIWNINSSQEINNAVSARNYVDGYILGNEGINEGGATRYSLAQLESVKKNLINLTSKPISTSEQENDFLYYVQGLSDFGDWISPNVHPYWNGILNASEASAWTRSQYEIFINNFPNRFSLFREVGYPTQGREGLSQELQAEYYNLLQESGTQFMYFEAFDQPWKNWNIVEPHWGLFDKDRKPKMIISESIIRKKLTRGQKLFDRSLGWKRNFSENELLEFLRLQK